MFGIPPAAADCLLRVVGLYQHVAEHRVFQPGFHTFHQVLIVDVAHQFAGHAGWRLDIRVSAHYLQCAVVGGLRGNRGVVGGGAFEEAPGAQPQLHLLCPAGPVPTALEQFSGS